MLQVPEWVVSAALVTWLLHILGWYTSNRHANDREARKEYRSALNSLEADIDRLIEAYRTYLTEDAATENEQARLKVHAELNRLRRHIESLESNVGSDLGVNFDNVFEAITGGDFESKARKRVNADRDHGRAVAAAESLIDCAENWFRQVYLAPRIENPIDALIMRWRGKTKN